MAKRKALSPKDWFENCGGWGPRHDLEKLHRGVAARLLNEQDEYGMVWWLVWPMACGGSRGNRSERAQSSGRVGCAVEKVHSMVFDRATRNVVLFDLNRDAWYGPTTCVCGAAYISALVAWHILLNRPIPYMIADEWCWYREGHWPCDFAEEPVGIAEGLVDFRCKFQVY